jgi:MFS family permease
VLAVLDGAIANVALPTIARDVNASPAASIWVVNAYQLTVTISLLPLASIGDIFGYRRVYRWGLTVFTIASLGCALSDSLLTLTLARIVQGFGAAGIMSVNGALIRFIYPRGSIGRGVGLNATIGSVSSATGPTVASAILSVAHWPWLFAVNVPIGSLAILIAWRALPRTPRAGHTFDVASAGMTALTIGLIPAARTVDSDVNWRGSPGHDCHACGASAGGGDGGSDHAVGRVGDGSARGSGTDAGRESGASGAGHRAGAGRVLAGSCGGELRDGPPDAARLGASLQRVGLGRIV